MFRTVCIPATLPGTRVIARGRSGDILFFPLCSLLLPPPTCSPLWLALFLPQKPGDKSRGSGCRGRTRGGKEGRCGGGCWAPGDCSGCQRAGAGGSPSGPLWTIFSGDRKWPTQSAGEREKSGAWVACDLSASHRDPRNLPTTEPGLQASPNTGRDAGCPQAPTLPTPHPVTAGNEEGAAPDYTSPPRGHASWAGASAPRPQDQPLLTFMPRNTHKSIIHPNTDRQPQHTRAYALRTQHSCAQQLDTPRINILAQVSSPTKPLPYPHLHCQHSGHPHTSLSTCTSWRPYTLWSISLYAHLLGSLAPASYLSSLTATGLKSHALLPTRLGTHI